MLSPFVLLVMFAFYFLPAVVALGRGMDKQAGVFVLNLFLGWTLIGWVVALCWAVSGETRVQALQRKQFMAQALGIPQPTYAAQMPPQRTHHAASFGRAAGRLVGVVTGSISRR